MTVECGLDLFTNTYICLFSPLLFLMVLDWLSKNAYKSKRLGLQCSLTQRLVDLDHADWLLWKWKEKDYKSLVVRYRLKINIQKTKEMRIGVRQQEPLEIHGEAVERVSEFTYLGSIINQTAGTDDDITARIRKAQTTFSMLMPVWKEKGIRLQTKLRIFNTSLPFCTVRKPGDRRNCWSRYCRHYWTRVSGRSWISLARGHFKWRTMEKDTSESYRKKHHEKKEDMDRAYATEAWE